MMRYGMYNEIFYAIGIIANVLIFGIIIISIGIPLLQNFVEINRRRWYIKNIHNQIKGGILSNDQGQVLLADIESKNSYNLYKSLKLYLGLAGIYSIFAGLMMLLLNIFGYNREGMETMINLLYFFPVLYGATLFLIFYKTDPTNRLLGEISTVSLFIGVAIFIFGSTYKFDITFIRGEILIYLTLAFGFFLIYKFKAILVSFLCSLIISLAAIATLGASISQSFASGITRFREPRDYNTTPFFDIYDGLLAYGYWFFAAGLLIIWHKRMRNAENLSIKEIFTGIFAFIMIMNLSIFVTGQHWLIGGLVGYLLTFLYSSYYFEKSNWFLSKPIHVFLIFLVSLTAIFGMDEILLFVSNNIFWKSQLEHSKWLGIFAIAVLLGISGLFLWFKFILPKKSFNYLFFGFPAVVVLGLLLGEYGGSYIFILYLMAMGINYIRSGISNKNETYIFIGVMLFIQGLITKLSILFQPREMNQVNGFKDWQAAYDDYMSRVLINYGGLSILIGLIFMAIVYFLREKWKVTGSNALDPEPIKLQSSYDTILDNTDIKNQDTDDEFE